MQKILYIGTKPFTDRLYNTGLSFDVKQSRDLPAETARLFLRHADLFELVESDSPKDTIKKDDDTQNQLNAQAQKNEQKAKDDNALQDLYVQVSTMDKDALEQFARDHYQVDLNKRKSLDNLRDEVVGLIDQFGVV